MDTGTAQRIDNYRPAVDVPDDVLEVLREAVRLVGPSSADEASCFLHAAARHAAWAVASSRPVTLRRLFTAEAVAASVADTQRGSESVSPYRARLSQLAGGVAGRKPKSTVQKPGRSLEAPYGAEELAALLRARGGMGEEEARCLTSAVALGRGAGIIGPAATEITGDHVKGVGSSTVIVAPGIGPVVVRGAWGHAVADIAARRGPAPLTSYYTTAGRQRVRRGLWKSRDVPEFKPHRLRAAWLVDLLNSGVPLDVVARLAGVRVATLHGYVGFADAAALGTLQTPDVTPFLELREQDAPRRAPQRDVAQTLATHQPRDPTTAAWWRTPGANELRDRVAAHSATGGEAKNLLTSLFTLLEWAMQQPGLPLEAEALLKGTTIGRWAAVQRREGREDSSVATYLARLRKLASPPGDRGAAPDLAPVRLPYSATERALLVAAAEPSTSALPDRLRFILATHVHTQLGAGIAPDEASAVVGTAVRRDADGDLYVTVGGPERMALVHPDQADALEALAGSAGDGPLRRILSQGRNKAYREAISSELGVVFDPDRLQASWVADRLEDGTSAAAICLGTGLSLSALGALVERCAQDRSLAEVVAWSGWARL